MNIAILGAGGHGKVVADAALAAPETTVVGFLDDDPTLIGQPIWGLTVIGAISCWQDLALDGVVPAIGDNRMRRTVFLREKARNAPIRTVMHPAAIVSQRTVVGIGTSVLAGAIINADTRVGENVIINTGAIVEHDCTVGSHVHIAPGSRLAGGVSVGEGSLLGIGCCILPGLHIGRWCVVGAGAVVTKDIADQTIVAGVPASILK